MPASTSSGQAATASDGLGINRADHVALRVADYDETIRFYTTKLNFQLEIEWTLGDAAPGVRLWPDPVHRSTCCESWWVTGPCRVRLPPASNGARP
jgi:catechol 2,3-dioxygenase-like lactoylglutathione lyase family enzyme